MKKTDLMDDSRRCHAKSKRSGSRCRRAAAIGQRVCSIHGAASPQAQRSAKERLAALADPALATLAEILSESVRKGEWSTAVRAALGVLDRCGYGPKSDIAMELAGAVGIEHSGIPAAQVISNLDPENRRSLLAAIEKASGAQPTAPGVSRIAKLPGRKPGAEPNPEPVTPEELEI